MKSDIAAGVFGKVFKLLALEEAPSNELSLRVWNAAKDYHFDYFLMGCDEELIKLGLALRDEKGLIRYLD